jgi:hypothetical protein
VEVSAEREADMTMLQRSTLALLLLALASAARADRQVIAPGTGLQSSVEVDSGANGICQTQARGDDLQAAAVGQGAPFEDEVRCGPDHIANTAAAGDDRQLIAVGAACQGAGAIVVDTGPDGIANSTATLDDVQLIPPGSAAPNTPCVLTGANGLADTPDPAGGDDVRIILDGHAEPNTAVIRCGPNHVAETTANNVHAGGDDVQLFGVGAPCPATNTIIVDSGANGIAETRAQGAELVLRLANPRPLTIPIRRRGTASRTVKLAVFNEEFAGPPSRAYTLFVTDGSCPRGTVTQVDADTRAPGLQTTASIAAGRHVKGSFLVTLGLENVTSVSRRIPFRCSVDVEADAVDTAPAADDAANPSNNAASVEVDAVDLNDL